jgi:hypothetical protein
MDDLKRGDQVQRRVVMAQRHYWTKESLWTGTRYFVDGKGKEMVQIGRVEG